MKLICTAYNEKRCKSCTYIGQDYQESLSQKISELKIPSVYDSISLDSLEGYRNKAKFVIGGTLDNPILGIPSIKNKYKLSELLDCPIHHKKLNQIAAFIKNSIQAYKLSPYSLDLRKGEFKYLVLSIGRKTNEVSVRFGMRSLESFERVKKLALTLQEEFSLIKVISFEIQPKHAALFEGETRYLTSKKFIEHDFDNFTLLSSTTNFFQVNSDIAKLLYNKVFERYEDENINLAVDLFCGVGGFALSMARFAQKVIGIEISQNAIDCAKELKVPNVEFFCDDAFKFPKYNKEKVDLLVVNPPRRGLGEGLSNLILEIAPDFFVYSSCNPDTFREDSLIIQKEYELESIIPVDMFALTSHLEILSFWKRK